MIISEKCKTVKHIPKRKIGKLKFFGTNLFHRTLAINPINECYQCILRGIYCVYSVRIAYYAYAIYNYHAYAIYNFSWYTI